MSETKKGIMDDSSPSVTLTVGQLKALVREEIEKAVWRWGVVQIYNKEYGGSEYSVVRFIEQCGEYRRVVKELG